MVRKGEIYIVQFQKNDGSHIQGGTRPVVVVSGDQKNKGNIVDITPLTSQLKRDDLYTHIVIEGHGLKCPSMTICEHTMPIDKEKLKKKNYVGTITDEKLLAKITKANQMQFV